MELSEKIARACIKQYESLGKNGKPRLCEWTLLAGIVKEDKSGNLEVVSLGTGSKCIGKTSMSKNGGILHDSHAEVIARRSFLLYLYEQITLALDGKETIFTNNSIPLKLGENVKFHFYCSHTPCGDCSIFSKHDKKVEGDGEATIISLECDSPPSKKQKVDLTVPKSLIGIHTNENKKKVNVNKGNKNSFSVDSDNGDNMLKNKLVTLDNSSENKEISSQNEERIDGAISIKCDVTSVGTSYLVEDIHRTGAKSVPGEDKDLFSPGVSYHMVGVLRTKPGRGEPTLSHSCSDKMFKWNVLGIQGAIIMLFIDEPIFLQSIVVGNCPFEKNAFERGIFGRFHGKLKALHLSETGFSIPQVLQTDVQFYHSKAAILNNNNINSASSHVSLIWSKTSIHQKKHEASVRGLKLGTKVKDNQRFECFLSVTRAKIMRTALGILLKVDTSDPKMVEEKINFASLTYCDLKMLSVEYQTLWSTLKRHVVSNWMSKPDELKGFTVQID